MLKVMFKVIQISTGSVSKMTIDMANITVSVKYEVTYGLSIGKFKFDLDTFSDRDHAQFYFEYLKIDPIDWHIYI